jgi:hypothetical protein
MLRQNLRRLAERGAVGDADNVSSLMWRTGLTCMDLSSRMISRVSHSPLCDNAKSAGFFRSSSCCPSQRVKMEHSLPMPQCSKRWRIKSGRQKYRSDPDLRGKAAFSTTACRATLSNDQILIVL